MTNDEKNTSEFNIKKNTYSDCLSSDLNSDFKSDSSSDSSSAPMENSSSGVSPNNNETESNCLSLTIVDDCNHLIKRNKLYKAIRMFFKVSFSTAILNFIKFFL